MNISELTLSISSLRYDQCTGSDFVFSLWYHGAVYAFDISWFQSHGWMIEASYSTLTCRICVP